VGRASLLVARAAVTAIPEAQLWERCLPGGIPGRGVVCRAHIASSADVPSASRLDAGSCCSGDACVACGTRIARIIAAAGNAKPPRHLVDHFGSLLGSRRRLRRLRHSNSTNHRANGLAKPPRHLVDHFGSLLGSRRRRRRHYNPSRFPHYQFGAGGAQSPPWAGLRPAPTIMLALSPDS
jgi:hypothetical protein